MPGFESSHRESLNIEASDNVMAMEILAIVKEELLPLLYGLVGVDSNPVVSIHHQDFHLTVGFRAVICKSDLAAHPAKITNISSKIHQKKIVFTSLHLRRIPR